MKKTIIIEEYVPTVKELEKWKTDDEAYAALDLLFQEKTKDLSTQLSQERAKSTRLSTDLIILRREAKEAAKHLKKLLDL